MNRLICSFLIILFSASLSCAYSPIARFDIVPYQRIKYGETFNAGVVAFSKPGIASVVFTITGQGYAGGTKTVSAMSNNPRLASTVSGYVGVVEYWVPISSSEFISNGAISLSATVTDNLGNVRVIDTLPMIVEGASAYSHTTAWVDATNSDGSGTVGDVNDPYPTIDSAVTATQTANGGDSSGNIIYVENGTYSIGDVSDVNTDTEYLTITRSSTATKDGVIINEGRPSGVNKLHLKGLTLKSQGAGMYIIHGGDVTYAWYDDCNLTGAGRGLSISMPAFINTPNHFATDCYVYDSDYGFYRAGLVRNTVLNTIGNDAFQNTEMIVNCRLEGISNTSNPTWHADAYQGHTTGVDPASNRIIYNYRITDAHYQGIFLRSDAGQATDNAFVNVLVEMREVPDINESSIYPFTPLSINQSWDHLLLWNITIPLGGVERTGTLTNSSIKGSYFWQWRDQSPSWATGDTNEVTDNHFENILGVTPTCTQTTKDIESSHPCPHYYAVAIGTDYTYGNGELDTDFTIVNGSSQLVDRFASVVPVDAVNTIRGDTSDIGVYELGAATESCDSSHLYICTTDGTCTAAGGYYSDGFCYSEDPTVTDSCENGVQDGDETGIDCGGSCPSACEVVVPTTSSSGAVYGAGYSRYGSGYMILQED
jgi:hypothetical protein